MAERSKRQIEIVQGMIEDALVSAREFERACEAFAESQKVDEMADVIDELNQWIEERDADRLEDLGILMEDGEQGELMFRIAERDEPFVVRVRDDMAIVVGGKILQLNPDLPILDDDIYEEVLERLFVWAGASQPKPRHGF